MNEPSARLVRGTKTHTENMPFPAGRRPDSSLAQFGFDSSIPIVSAEIVAELVQAPPIDDSQWPVVLVTMPRQPLPDHEFLAFLTRLSVHWQRGLRFGLVVDVRAAPPLAPEQRRLLAERLDLNAAQYPNTLQGVAVVLTSSIQRGIVSVLTWLMKRPYEIQAFPTIELGSAWVLRRLAKPVKTSKRPSPSANG